MPSNLQRGIVAENSVRLGDSIFKASEQKLDNQSTQYGKTRVHRNESNLNDLDPDMDPSRLWKSSEGRTVYEEHQVDASDVLSDIGDNFHDLADSFSVL